MYFDDETIKKILLDGNYVEEADIKKAEEYAADHRGSLLEYLLSQKLLTREIVGQAVAESLKVPYADLGTAIPPKEQVTLIPEELAKKFRVVVFAQKKSEIVLATDGPTRRAHC